MPTPPKLVANFLLILVLMAAPPLSWAQDALSSLKTTVMRLNDEGRAAEALSLIQAAEDSMAGDPEFDYLLGVQALKLNRPELALQALERAVLVQPSFAGAWLDLSIAYFRLGDVPSATQILAHVEDNFSPSPPMRAELARARSLMSQHKAGDGWRVEAMLLGGHVRNANFGINSTNLQITPAGGSPVNIILSPEYKPRGDTAAEARVGAAKRFSLPGGAYGDFQAALRTRQYNHESGQDLLDFGASWMQTIPISGLKDTAGTAGITLRHIGLGGSTLGDFVTLLLEGRRTYGSCAGSVRTEYDRRFYQYQNQSDAEIVWLGAGLACSRGAWALQSDYRYGWDHAKELRAGGDTRRQELSALARWQVTDRLQVRGVAYFADYQDEEGFSPLLSQGAPRTIHRLGKRLEVQWALPLDVSNRMSLQLEIDDVDNRSNLSLSRYSDTQIFMGLRYQFF